MYFSLTLVSYVSYCLADAMSDSFSPLYLSITSVKTEAQVCYDQNTASKIITYPSKVGTLYIAQLTDDYYATLWAESLSVKNKIEYSTFLSDYTYMSTNLTFRGDRNTSPSLAAPSINENPVTAFTDWTVLNNTNCGSVYLLPIDCIPYGLIPLEMYLNEPYGTNPYFYFTPNTTMPSC